MKLEDFNEVREAEDRYRGRGKRAAQESRNLWGLIRGPLKYNAGSSGRRIGLIVQELFFLFFRKGCVGGFRAVGMGD